MPELAILIPTRGRPGNILKVISAWDFTSAWDVADMVLIVDADDPEIEAYREFDRSPVSPISVAEVPVWMPMVHKLDMAARDLAPRYFALGFAGDDHLPQTINWAGRYLAVLHELQTGMVYGDDGYQGQKLSTEWAVTSDAVRALGRMVPAPVEHMYCDNSMMDLFGAAGALRHLPEVRIEHMHPVAGKAETDAQYQRVNHRDQFKKDRTHYEVWRKVAMDVQVDQLKALRAGLPEVRPQMAAQSRLTPGSRPKPVPARSGPRGSKAVTRLPVPKSLRKVKGATPDEIGLTLADMAIGVPPDEAIVEIGVYQGRTALLMAWGAQQGNKAHVWGIDAWGSDGNTYGPPFTESETWARYNVEATGYKDAVTLIRGFGHLVADSWALESRPVGLLFVDGDHSKEGARRDIEAWAGHLAPGAIIAVDDYDHPDYPGVREALEELVTEGLIEPVQVFHDRMAVTKLVSRDDSEVSTRPAQVQAITSEGVSPSPYPAAEGQVAMDPVDAMFDRDHAELSGHPVLQPITLEKSGDLETVHFGELGDIESGTPITDLNLVHLKALAKARGIVLGARKDKRDLILQALRDGR
jgi:predicted O-methyltransferase YrrM